MKRRKNAVYTGQSKNASTGIGDRVLVDAFYVALNQKLRPEDEIEIIPPEQVNPTHSPLDQVCIMADYCVRKIVPEITSLFRWGDEVTPRLRAHAPIVDSMTASRAAEIAYVVIDARNDPFNAPTAFNYAYAAIDAAIDVTYYVSSVNTYTRAASETAKCVYLALIACIEADDEAAYNRIIALTNEMLESL